MAREKHTPKVGPFLFTLDGNEEGNISVSDTCGFYVKQSIILKSDTVERVDLEIKRVLSRTELKVGRRGHKIDDFVDITAFLIADNATIRADEQSKRRIPPEDIQQAKWMLEPINADRNILVDPYGEFYKVDNPLPVKLSDGSIDIGTVNAELEVQLSHQDNVPNAGDVADSTQIGDGVEILQINPDGSINTNPTEVSSVEIRKDIINNIVYKGIAAPNSDSSDPVWKISRTVSTFNNTTGVEDEVTLVAGTGVFDQIWDNRVSLFPAETPIDFSDRRFERLIPILTNANWMQLGNFDRVTPTFTDDAVTMSYFESGAKIGQAEIRYINELDWEINLERYIVESDGDMLLDDDDTPLFLD